MVKKQFLRIFNTAVDGNLPISRALRKIKGFGSNLTHIVCFLLKIDPKTLAGDLEDAEGKNIENLISNPEIIPTRMLNRQKDFETGKNQHIVGPTLRLTQEFDIKRLRRIKSYKGVRHGLGLPVRGQSTKAHFRKKGKAVGVKKPRKR